MMKVLFASIFIILFSISPAKAFPDIIIRDIVVPAGKEVMLRAEVKGKLFRKGGELIEFFVNGKSIGGIREIAFFDKVHKDISLLNYIAAISVFLKALLIPKLVRLSSKSLQEKTPIP
ncbi:MAG: hypothetical protein ABIB41_08530 [Nitrospirota bacterium]